jgi:arginine utilization protein RocB
MWASLRYNPKNINKTGRIPVKNLGPYDHPPHQQTNALYNRICPKIEIPEINKKFLTIPFDNFEILE